MWWFLIFANVQNYMLLACKNSWRWEPADQNDRALRESHVVSGVYKEFQGCPFRGASDAFRRFSKNFRDDPLGFRNVSGIFKRFQGYSWKFQSIPRMFWEFLYVPKMSK